MYPKWWVNYVFGCLKPFFKNYLTIPTFVPNLEVLLTATRC